MEISLKSIIPEWKHSDKVKLPSVGVFRRTGCASAGVATARRVFSCVITH